MHIIEKACKCGSLSYSSLWCTNIPVSTQFSLLKINSSITSHGPINNPLSLLRVTFYRQLSIINSLGTIIKHIVYHQHQNIAFRNSQCIISIIFQHTRRCKRGFHLLRTVGDDISLAKKKGKLVIPGTSPVFVQRVCTRGTRRRTILTKNVALRDHRRVMHSVSRGAEEERERMRVTIGGETEEATMTPER